MALKAQALAKEPVKQENKVEVEEVKSDVKEDKPFKFVKDEKGRLSIKIIR